MTIGKCSMDTEANDYHSTLVVSKHPSVDRIVYIPLQSAHILEYQEEMIDAEGNVYWKTVDSTTIGGATSVKEFLEQMKDFYESKSCRKDRML